VHPNKIQLVSWARTQDERFYEKGEEARFTTNYPDSVADLLKKGLARIRGNSGPTPVARGWLQGYSPSACCAPDGGGDQRTHQE